MVEVLDDKKRDENQNKRKALKNTQKTFMILEQQEAFLEQFSEIVLGTWRPK